MALWVVENNNIWLAFRSFLDKRLWRPAKPVERKKKDVFTEQITMMKA